MKTDAKMNTNINSANDDNHLSATKKQVKFFVGSRSLVKSGIGGRKASNLMDETDRKEQVKLYCY